MALAGREESAVIRSARKAALPETYEAGVRVARRLARELDRHPDDWEVAKDIAPKLLAALTALGLTESAAKASTKGGVVPDGADSTKDELAALRAKHSRNA